MVAVGLRSAARCLPQGGSGPHRRRRCPPRRDPRPPRRGDRGSPGAPRPTPRRPGACRAGGARARPRDPSLELAPAAAGPVRRRPVPRAHGRRRRGRVRIRLHRAHRAVRRRRATAARGLARAGGRAVLRRDARGSGGPDQPPSVPLGLASHHRLLGRGVRPRGTRGRGRARRPVRLHRQSRRLALAADARRPQHDPGGPGRDHPRLVPRPSRRGRRTRHGQDGRRTAPGRLPDARRAAARPRRDPVHRAAPAVPGLHRGRAAGARRGQRPRVHAVGPGPGGEGRRPHAGRAGSAREDPEVERPPARRSGLRGPLSRARAERPALRGDAVARRDRGAGGMDRGVRRAGARHAAQ